jgi:hypothetical protein
MQATKRKNIVATAHKSVHARGAQRLDTVAHTDYFTVAGNLGANKRRYLRGLLSGFSHTVQTVFDGDYRLYPIQPCGNFCHANQ